VKSTDINDKETIEVHYNIRNEFGKFVDVHEEFDIHEDGDPLFVLEQESYKKLIHSDKKKQMWKIVTTEGMQRFIIRNPGQNFWAVDGSTGNTYKYIL
jgi:hypothetical protein